MAPPQLPAIRISSEFEGLNHWGLEDVKAFGNSIPAYRYSASEYNAFSSSQLR